MKTDFKRNNFFFNHHIQGESEVAQSCPTLCDPKDCSLPSSSVHRIFQARVLEWGATAFSNRLQFLGYINNSGTKSLPQKDFQSVFYLADRCKQAATYFYLFGLGSWRCQSCHRLILPSFFLPVFLLPLFSLPLSSNSPSGLVSSFQSTSILKNLLSWWKKNHPPPFTAFSCGLSPLSLTEKLLE